MAPAAAFPVPSIMGTEELAVFDGLPIHHVHGTNDWMFDISQVREADGVPDLEAGLVRRALPAGSARGRTAGGLEWQGEGERGAEAAATRRRRLEPAGAHSLSAADIIARGRVALGARTGSVGAKPRAALASIME